MTADTKLTALILLWIADKIIMFAIIHWEMRRRKRSMTITKDANGEILVKFGGNGD